MYQCTSTGTITCWYDRISVVKCHRFFGAYLNADLQSPEFMRLSKDLVDMIEAGGTDEDLDK